MKIQVGSGSVRLPDFVNVDIRPVAETDVVGHAGDLRSFGDGTVEMIFSHAVFEHVFLAHQLSAVREWRRVLSDTGLVVCMGIPDFSTIARLYLEGARGVIGDRFDLFNVYRYTHGEPEHATTTSWAAWRPETQPDSAPAGWLPQLHKSLFDAGYLRSLLEAGGFSATIFNYVYPGEEHPLNLGAIATPAGTEPPPADFGSVRDCLAQIPQIDRCLILDTLCFDRSPKRAEGLLDYGAKLAATPLRPEPTGVKARGGLVSWIQGLRTSSGVH